MRTQSAIRFFCGIYQAIAVGVALYSLGLFVYMLLWLPRTRLRYFGMVIGAAEEIGLLSSFVVMLTGLLISAGFFATKNEPPPPIIRGFVISVISLLLSIVLFGPVVG